MKLSFLRLGWRTLLRDLRAGELRLLMVAVTLAVAALTSVGFFADRLQGGLQRDALQLLGGDVVVASDNPTPQAFVDKAQALGLQAVGTMGFPTMGRASDAQGGASKLVALKSVAAGYPLRGTLKVADAPGAAEQATRDIPAPGEVWVDAPLLDALAATMDRDEDVVVLYMTSHGARDHQLAAAHPPLQVDPMTPELLRHMLDDAGIRHRVIAISACYSGGWLDALTTPSTLIMTAADATHTSYGCGTRSELTFFGRAVFHEQLRSTYSFTEAFTKAVPIIAQREIQAGKDDGFSNPQMRVGAEIDPVLNALARRLAAEEGPVLRPGGKGLVAQIPMAYRTAQLR